MIIKQVIGKSHGNVFTYELDLNNITIIYFIVFLMEWFIINMVRYEKLLGVGMTWYIDFTHTFSKISKLLLKNLIICKKNLPQPKIASDGIRD